MGNLLSKLHGGKKKESGIPPADEMRMPTALDGALASSSAVPTPGQVKEPKRTLGGRFREHLKRDKPAKKQPPETRPHSESAQPHGTIEDTEPPPQTDSLLINRLNIDRHEDPKDQKKLDALEISIQVLDAFSKLTGVVGLVLPDALGLALEYITVILEKLKKLVENKQAWKELLIAIDDRQRSFNEQLDGVNAQDLSKKLVAPICQYTDALKKLAASAMEQSGVTEKGAPTDSRFMRIKRFINQFVNTDSDAENINDCKAQLADAMNEFQFKITMYLATTLSNVDASMNQLVTMSFLEGGGSTSLLTKHKTCLRDTRVEVLKHIRKWKDTEDADAKPVYCIRDVAGTGKSTIAYTMAEEWGTGQCFVFFASDYSKPGAEIVCKSLAKQIVRFCHGPGSVSHWRRVCSNLLSTRSLKYLWENLVAEPLGNCTVHKSHVLVVDALDACDINTRRPLLEHMLRTCSSQSSPYLRILLTTRALDDICGALEQEGYRNDILYRHLLNSESSLSDVRRYVKHRLEDSRFDEISETQREKFVQRCQGLFIFASTACDQLEEELTEDQSAALEDILQEFTSLDAVYHRALNQAKKALNPDEKASDRLLERLKNILRVILVAKEALSISAIADILSISTKSADKHVKRLGSIIASGTVDQPVFFLHATLAEFLLRPDWIGEKDNESDLEKVKKQENAYHITEAEGHRVILKGCLSGVMKEQLQFNICRLETSYLLNEELEDLGDRVKNWISPGLRYSCHQWANHLKSNPFDPEIFSYLQYFMNHQFLFWLEVLSLTKQVNEGPHMLSLLIDWIEAHGQDETLSMPADMKTFVSTFARVISQSVSHIYLSALSFAPPTSTVRQRYIQSYQQTLIIQTGGLSDWPGIQNVFEGHKSQVDSVAFSRDGKRIVSGSEDKTVRVWDATTGEVVAGPLKGHDAAVTSVAFSWDGTHIVSGSEDETVRVWHVATGKIVAGPFEGHHSSVCFVAFSQSGTVIISGSDDGTVRSWGATTGKGAVKPLEVQNVDVSSVAFSPTGSFVVTVSNEGTFRVWDAGSGRVIRGPHKVARFGFPVALSPDGMRIVGATGTVQVWDTTTGQVVAGPFDDNKDLINSVAFSSDGTRIVSGSDDQTVRVWDIVTSQVAAGPFQGHTHDVTCVAFSTDGKHIVSGSYDGTVRIWDATTPEVVDEEFEGGYILSVAFSQDGTRIVSGSDDRSVRVWDAITGVEVAGPFEQHYEVNFAAFSEDGTRIFSATNTGMIQILNATTGEIVAGPFGLPWFSISCAAVSPDGGHIVSGSEVGLIRVWDATTGEVVAGPLKGHDAAVTSVAFSWDGTHVVSGSEDETIRVWEATTGKVVAGPFEGHSDSVNSVAFSWDGTRIVSGSQDNTVQVWDATTGIVVAGPFLGHSDPVNSVAFSRDGTRIVSGSQDNTVQVWDATTGIAAAGPFLGHSDPVNSVAFSWDGTCIVSGSEDKTVRVWDAKTGEVVAGPFKGHDAAVTSVAFSQDGTRVVSASDDRSVRVWDTITGVKVAGPFEQRHEVNFVAFSEDGTRIFSATNTGMIQILNATTGEIVAGPFGLPWFSISCAAVSLDGGHIVSGSNDGLIRVWDATTGEVVTGPFKGHCEAVNSVAFSPDARGSFIVSGSGDKTVRVWDATTGKVVAGPFEGHSDWVNSVAFSGDGTRIVSGSADKTVQVWDVTTGKVVAGPFLGHSDRVNSVAFSRDNTRIVSGSEDKTVQVWDVTTGKVVAGPFLGHEWSVNSVAFSHDGTRIVSGSSDVGIRVWDARAHGLEESDQSSVSFTCNSKMEDGWIMGPNSEHLFWVPPMLRRGLARPGNTLIIGQPMVTELNLRWFMHGKLWTHCKNSEFSKSL